MARLTISGPEIVGLSQQVWATGAALGIFVWGSKVRGLGDGKSPSGVQGQSPGRGLGDKVPQKLKHF